MARIRTIKPEFWHDPRLAEITGPANLVLIASWNFSDDYGVFENDPALLKSLIFPRRQDVTVALMNGWLTELVVNKFIFPFHYGRHNYFFNNAFLEDQKINKPSPPTIPFEILESLKANLKTS